MFYKSLFAGAIALAFSAAFSSPSLAQMRSPQAQEDISQSVELSQRNDPRSPLRRGDQPEIFENTDLEPIDGDEETGGNSVEFFLRLNTELFVNGGDLVEFEVPIRYAPNDRLSMQASPIIKYFPENAEEEFDYGFKFAVEYRL
ncbi:MAG: hypothetical protein AAFR12_18585 [Cyanobacteria bacterium J06626_6]